MRKKNSDSIKSTFAKYEKIMLIPQTFDDSTHQLWRLENSSHDQQHHFLKVCSNTESPFWQIMHDLFDYDLRTEIPNFAESYVFIDEVSRLDIPKLIKAEIDKDNNAYILTAELEGVAAGERVNDTMVRQLAEHLAELHSKPIETWGGLSNPKFTAEHWTKRLNAVLEKSTIKWGGVILESRQYLKQATEACELMETVDFVPMMPDLRWDQFLQVDNRLSALVDLDAFVYAPRELDFVILEYILTKDQLEVFKVNYLKHNEIPELILVRPVYRLLLFYMQIMGETDLNKWMNRELFFYN